VQRKTPTRSEHVREMLEEGIATGMFPPGMRLDEVELSQRFDVSRTPLREALFQLASAGIVEMQPRRGTVVAEVSPHRMVEMFEVMGELEAMCGRLAARRMLPNEHETLLAAHRACEAARAANNPDAYYYENERFHHIIYDGSHNGFLEQQASALHRRLRPYPPAAIARTRSHAHVVARARRGGAGDPGRRCGADGAAACAITVVVQGQRFADLVASLAELQSGAATLAMMKPAAPEPQREPPPRSRRPAR